MSTWLPKIGSGGAVELTPDALKRRATVGEIGGQLGRKVLDEVAVAALQDAIMRRYQRLGDRKFGGPHARRARAGRQSSETSKT